jgi:hypothetical protein
MTLSSFADAGARRFSDTLPKELKYATTDQAVRVG